MYVINFLFCIFSLSVCIIICNFKMNVFLFLWLVYIIGGYDFYIKGYNCIKRGFKFYFMKDV